MDPTIIASLIQIAEKPLDLIISKSARAIKDKLLKIKAEGIIENSIYRQSNIDFVKTIYSREKVRLSDIYYPAKVFFGTKSVQADSRNRINSERNILIKGTVGQGKSCLLRHLYLNETKTSGKIPLFIELRNISEEQNLNNLIIEEIKYLGLEEADEDIFKHLLKQGFFTIFLDGLDEVKKEFTIKTRSQLRELSSLYKNTRIVITSRPGAISDIITTRMDFDETRIVPLNKDDYKPYLLKLNNNQFEEKIDSLVNEIEKSKHEIKGVIKTPLMLTLVYYAFGTSVNIPDSLDYFYQTLFGILVSTHDQQKDNFKRQRSTSLNDLELEEAFKAFSFISKDYGPSLKDEEFKECSNEASRTLGKVFNHQAFKSDLTDFICLMQPDGINTSYIHKSIQEFFAASFIKSLKNPSDIEEIYNLLATKSGVEWFQEITFLSKIDNLNYLKFIKRPAFISIGKIFTTNRKTIKDFNTFLNENFYGIEIRKNGKLCLIVKENSEFNNYGFMDLLPDDFQLMVLFDSDIRFINDFEKISHFKKNHSPQYERFFSSIKKISDSSLSEVENIDKKINRKEKSITSAIRRKTAIIK